MFRILDAVSLNNEQLTGGTTRPLQVDVMDNDGNIESYVVKIFSKTDLEQNDSCFKEFYCHEIIKYFDLNTPEVALIRFNEDFLTNYPSVRPRINQSGMSYHFGSKYGDYISYPGFIRNNEIDLYDMENILAVDALMFNVDRRIDKPNFLVSGDSYTLIDHEKTFGLNLSKNIKDGRYNLYYASDFSKHVFKGPLKKYSKKTEINYGVFSYFLERLDITKINITFKTFDRYKIPYNSQVLVNEQLSAIKENKEPFIEFLKNFIR